MVRLLTVGIVIGSLLLFPMIQMSAVEAQIADGAAVKSPDLVPAAAVRAMTAARMSSAIPAPMPELRADSGSQRSVSRQSVQPQNPDGLLERIEPQSPGGAPGGGPFLENTLTLPLSFLSANVPAGQGFPYYCATTTGGPYADTPADFVVGNTTCNLVHPPFTNPTSAARGFSPPYNRSGVFPFSLYNDPLGTVGRFPWISHVKIFFTNVGYDPSGGTFVCSGTSINSGIGGNESLVLTAGHCVNSGGDGNQFGLWSTNVLVCPAWRDGNAPLGCWPGKKLLTLGGWYFLSNLRRDVGMIVVARDSNTGTVGPLNRVVGAYGLIVNAPRTQEFWSFGYPAASPFNGHRLQIVTSPRSRDDIRLDYYFPGAGPTTMGIGSDLTGGSSGGGWIMRARMGNPGYANGLNSYKWVVPREPRMMHGPYFDTSVKNLWNNARVVDP